MMKNAKNKTIYVALLRGINVGGNNKVDMKLLKKTFESVGMTSVKTYINSGNVIFADSERSGAEISALLEEAILRDFKLKIYVLVRSQKEFKKVITALPADWENNQEMKSDVLFLWDDVKPADVKKSLPREKDIDTVKYVTGAVLWNVDRKTSRAAA